METLDTMCELKLLDRMDDNLVCVAAPILDHYPQAHLSSHEAHKSLSVLSHAWIPLGTLDFN